MTLWVLKIGTSLLRGTKDQSTSNVIKNLCLSISKIKKKGDQVVIVSSGAVGLGCCQLGKDDRPKDLTSLQAYASVGQGYLMSLYEKHLADLGYKVGQILLTKNDLESRPSYKNACLTLKKLLEMKVVPIINENDTVSTEELSYGDNDTLSALVATAIKADHLVLLTDIDRLYSSDPKKDKQAKPIEDVIHLEDLKSIEEELSIGDKTEWGTGGIKTKLIAARIATSSGITVHLADGREEENLNALIEGSRVGTVFHPSSKPISNKKSWLAHVLSPCGNIYIDHGASEAILDKGASLLCVGITKADGKFLANQPVKVINDMQEEVARGITSMSQEEILSLLSGKTDTEKSKVVIHRDFLVVTNEKKG
tara:strand:- start:374 stop:1474 length:1101 start_codon:yes stop_codon:yes gene_type:complete